MVRDAERQLKIRLTQREYDLLVLAASREERSLSAQARVWLRPGLLAFSEVLRAEDERRTGAAGS